MNLTQLILAAAAIFSTHFALAGEFNHGSIRMNLPSNFAERKIAQTEGNTTYVLTRPYGSGSPQEIIGISVHIRDISNDSEAQQRLRVKGVAYEAELSLAVAVRNLAAFPQFKLVKDFRPLDMSGNKAVTATVSYLGSYAVPAWTNGVANVAIYCITEPTREIEFQVFALSDAPKDLVSSAIEAVENVELETP